MTLNTVSDSKYHNFLLLSTSSHPVNDSIVYKNHQKWQIRCQFDHQTNFLAFHLKDPFGLSHTVTEFIVDNIDFEFGEKLKHLTSVEDQQKLIYAYLQHRLESASPFQVHIERHHNRPFIRFGEHGLHGGINGWDIWINKTGAFLFSAAQIGIGIYLTANRNNLGKLGGGALISSGLATGMYTYQTDENEKKYTNIEYTKQAIYGIISGLISGAFEMKAIPAASIVTKIGWQALGSATSNATATAVAEYINQHDEENEQQIREMISKVIHKALSGGIGGGVGIIAGSLTNAALTNEMANQTGEAVSSFVHEFMEKFRDNVMPGIHILRKMAETGVSSASSQFASGYYENVQEQDESKKKDFLTQAEEALQSALIGAALSGITAYVEQTQKIQENNQEKHRIEQTQKELKEAHAQKIASENTLQELQENLKQAQQNLLEKNVKLRFQEQNLQEKKAQQQKTHTQTAKDQQVINQAPKIPGTAEHELHGALQAHLEAQERVIQTEQAVWNAQKAVSSADQLYHSTTQAAMVAQQTYLQLVVNANKEIGYYTNRGYKAKISGHFTKNESEILNAFLQGEKIEWQKRHNRFLSPKEITKAPASLYTEKYQQAQKLFNDAQQGIRDLTSSISQKQTELKIAQDQLNLKHQAFNQAQEKFNAAQESQLRQQNLKNEKDKQRSHKSAIRQAKREMSDTLTTIQTLEQQTNQLQTTLQEERTKLQALSNKERGLTALSQEQHAALRKAHQDYDKPIHVNTKTYSCLRTDPGLQVASITYSDCTLQELIPHVVLVHALSLDAAPDHLFQEITDATTLKDKLMCYIKGIITVEGIIGHHLQLKKGEFCGSLVPRPHVHWSWNQLVQPNSGGEWEEAQIAVLEPLSVFENSTCNKPFGVAPYDTFTVGPHRFSNESVLLVPEFIVNEVRSYLPSFGNRIISYTGTLRSPVIHALETYYKNVLHKDIWHICDEEGKLIGKKILPTKSGYQPATCLRKTDGQVVILLRNEGVFRADGAKTLEEQEDIKGLQATAIKDYYKSKRFIGLHVKAATVWIEDNSFFKTLKAFKENHAKVKDNPQFAGGIKDSLGLAQWGLLKVLELYHQLLRFNPHTGVFEVADYYINEAIYADLVSLFYQLYPSTNFNLTPLDIKMLFASERIYLLNLIENIKKNLQTLEQSQKETAKIFFDSYCTKLKQNIINIKEAKEEVKRMLTIDRSKTQNDHTHAKMKPSCLLVAQTEWEKIELPANNIEFDLGENWPLNPQLNDYKDKILDILPTDLRQLQQLYWQLSAYAQVLVEPQTSHQSGERKERYRLNIISSCIEWSLQERIYRQSKDDCTQLILTSKLLKHISWASKYQLQPEDFTKKLGDCLFDNITAQLSNNTMTPQELRQAVVRFMREHSEDYSGTPDYDDNELRISDGKTAVFFENWEQYLTHMVKPEVWGTELEIQAAALTLDAPIVVLSVEEKPKIYNLESKNHPLFLLHVDDNHFTACSPLEGTTAAEIYAVIKSQNHY